MIPKFFLFNFNFFNVLITEIKESGTLKSKKKLIDQLDHMCWNIWFWEQVICARLIDFVRVIVNKLY